MSNSAKNKIDPWDAGLFDCSDVTWEILPSKRNDQITIVMKCEGSFNLIKTYLSLKRMAEKIEQQLNIMDEADGEH